MLTKAQKEALAVAAYLASNFVLNTVTVLTMAYFLVFGYIGRYIALLYILWIYIDRGVSERGGRGCFWYRSLPWWKYHRDYFPVSLHKTAPLPADKNYIVGIFPHGVVCVAGYSVFVTEVHNVPEVFPGIRFYLATIPLNFLLPLFREIMHLIGAVSVSRKSLDWILGHSEGGNAAVIYIGGASEAAYSGHDDTTLNLKNRKGFCRLALKHGSHLVPCFAFGEKDLFKIYTPAENTKTFVVQEFIRRVTGVILLLFYGNKDYYYVLPNRVPIHLVMGKPIEVEKNLNPSEEEVDALHQQFINKLTELYEDNKEKYQSNPASRLIIV